MRDRISRRKFVKSTAVAFVAAAAGRVTPEPPASSTIVQVNRNNRILLKGGMVLTPDRNVGDFEIADVLIEGKKIAAVQPNLKAEGQVIDASNTIVMPGFIDTHHHQYETILRSILADGLLTGPKSYIRARVRVRTGLRSRPPPAKTVRAPPVH